MTRVDFLAGFLVLVSLASAWEIIFLAVDPALHDYLRTSIPAFPGTLN